MMSVASFMRSRTVGDGVAHFAAGTIAEEPHGVQGFASAAGGDQDDFAGEVVAASQRVENRVGDGIGFGHAARADHAAGELAGAGLDDAHASLAKDFEIGLGGRMLPHVDVHGRGDEDGRGGGEVEGGEKIVGHAVREFGQRVGGGGCDDQRLGGLGFANVLNGGVVSAVRGIAFRRSGFVPKAGDDLVAGECCEGERLHEARRRLGHDDVDFEGLSL
jgi:hypothetical protein